MGFISQPPVNPSSLVPVGAVLPFAGPTTPPGYLACDGFAVSRADYPSLFAAIGTTHGAGNGTTTFNLPDLRDRFPVGASVTNALGAQGGSASVTLTEAQIPSHTHGASSAAAGGHTHPFVTNVAGITTAAGGIGVQRDVDQFGGNAQRDSQLGAVAAHAHSITVAAAGGGGAHENRPPFVGLHFVIRAQ